MPMRGAAAAAPANPSSTATSEASATSRRSTAPSVLGMHADDERVHAAAVGAADAEMEPPERQFLAGFGQVADRRRDEAADRVVFVVREVGAEALVEIGDRR